MILRRATCGALGALVVLPLELAQGAAETGRAPTVHALREARLAVVGGGGAYAVQSAARAHLPPAAAATVAALVLAPCAVLLRYARVSGRYATTRRGSRLCFALWSCAHEFLFCLLVPRGVLLAVLVAYLPRLAATRSLLPGAAVTPRAVVLDVLRASVGMRIAMLADAHTR